MGFNWISSTQFFLFCFLCGFFLFSCYAMELGWDGTKIHTELAFQIVWRIYSIWVNIEPIGTCITCSSKRFFVLRAWNICVFFFLRLIYSALTHINHIMDAIASIRNKLQTLGSTFTEYSMNITVSFISYFPLKKHGEELYWRDWEKRAKRVCMCILSTYLSVRRLVKLWWLKCTWPIQMWRIFLAVC